MTNALGDDPGVTRVHQPRPSRTSRQAGAHVDEVEIPDLFDLIVATSMYTDRSKHDLDLFLASCEDPPISSLNEAYDNGQYDKRLDLMDAIMDGPAEPDEDPEYLKRFAARHEFTLVVENVLARHDAIVYPSVQVPPPTLEGRKDWTTLTLPDEHADRLPDVAAGDHRARRASRPTTPPSASSSSDARTRRRRCSGSRTPTSRRRTTERRPTASSPA